MDLVSILLTFGVPSAITGFGCWYIKRTIDKNDKKRDEKERAREQNEFLLVKSVRAAISLSEATAHAMQRGHTNGDMEEALKYAQKVKHEQKEFLQKQALQNIYEEL